MKSILAAVAVLSVAAVCLLMVSALPQQSQAQLQATADGATLEAKARRALNALTGQSPGALWAELAPWQQNALRLRRAQAQRAAESEPAIWRAESEYLSGLDPRGRFTLDNPENLRALADHEYLGLLAGIYQLDGVEKAAESMAGEWFAVERMVGLGQHRTDSGNIEVFILQTMGTLTFENLEGSRVTVVAVAEGSQWHITEVGWQLSIGREGRGSLSRALGRERRPTMAPSAEPRNAQRAEGEQILGAMRNMARVHFARMGTAPATLSDARVEASHRAGKYYTARDKVWSKDMLTILAADANDGSGACILIVFTMDSGKSRSEHFDSKAEMERRIEELLEEADPLDE